jgi:ArsR family transcriptional regulator
MKEQEGANMKQDRPLDAQTFAAVCKALGHPARIRILEHLREVDSCICGQIVEILPLAQSTVSQHLKSLKQAGLVKGEVEGPAVCYCVDKTVLEAFQKRVAAL